MKKIILFLLILPAINTIHGQSSQAYIRDSLHQALKNEKTDTGRVLLLAELAYQLHEFKPDTALMLAFEALTLSRKIGFEKGEAASLNRIGNVWNVLGNYTKGMQVYLQALQINEKINNIAGIRRNYNNIGTIYRAQDNLQPALNYFFKAKELGEILKDKQALSITLTNIGATYLELKKPDSATLYTQQAYHMAKDVNYARQIGGALEVLGRINAESGEHRLALEYYRQGIPYYKKAENFIGLSSSYLGMAKLFENIQQNDSALIYARQSLLLAKEKKFTIVVRDAGRYLTSYYRKINKPDSAFFYLDITKIANDSLFNQQKSNQMQTLVLDEKMRQQEIAAAELKVNEERKRNLQYAAIALGLITFIILFLLLSHSIIANQKLIRFFGVVALLMVFEFINLYIHPYLAHATDHSPLLMLLVMVCIAAMLVPVHHWLEKWITHQLVEKNKKIRLAAAKKTIATLEGEQA